MDGPRDNMKGPEDTDLAPGGLSTREFLSQLDRTIEDLERDGRPFDAGTMQVFRDTYASLAE